ncbi:hypothetical protein JOC76_001424 [Neobacillus cucumis]|nr:hypothetical protein [Neobacillus cucumis]
MPIGTVLLLQNEVTEPFFVSAEFKVLLLRII